jgi:hypothetical protein
LGRIALFSLIGGILLTLVSAIYVVNPTPGVLGAKNLEYGLPMAWLKSTQIIVPGLPTTWSILWSGLLLDVLFWWIIVAIVLYAVKSVRK